MDVAKKWTRGPQSRRDSEALNFLATRRLTLLPNSLSGLKISKTTDGYQEADDFRIIVSSAAR
jgi:hypothetical protein